jgi:hypothetical protein
MASYLKLAGVGMDNPLSRQDSTVTAQILVGDSGATSGISGCNVQLSSPQNVSDIPDAQHGVQCMNRTVNSPPCASLGQLNLGAACPKIMQQGRVD